VKSRSTASQSLTWQALVGDGFVRIGAIVYVGRAIGVCEIGFVGVSDVGVAEIRSVGVGAVRVVAVISVGVGTINWFCHRRIVPLALELMVSKLLLMEQLFPLALESRRCWSN
jgi:hypothetical protein